MKKLTMIFSLFLIGATLSFAQVNSNYDGPKPEVRAGAKSFVFMYTPFQSNFNPVRVSSTSFGNDNGGNLNFTTETLTGIGFQYYVSNEFAVILGANFGTSSSEMTVTTTGANPTSTLTKESVTNFGISLDANYHLKALYSVSPYVGVNVNIGSKSGTRDVTVTGGAAAPPLPLNQEISGSGFGAGLNVGFDWYFTEGLSLGGKYTLGFNSIGTPEATSTQGTATQTTKGTSSSSIGTGSASVMLNVHF